MEPVAAGQHEADLGKSGNAQPDFIARLRLKIERAGVQSTYDGGHFIVREVGVNNDGFFVLEASGCS